MGFYSQNRLKALGLKRIGKDVMLSDKASLYNPSNIEIGDHSRIDDFCVLSAGKGGICIGQHVHIAVFCSLIGAGRIEVHDFASISSRTSVYSSNDDYSGNFLINPTIPAEFTNVSSAPVVFKRHVIVGAGCIILPGVTFHECSGVGALSLVKSDCEAFGMYAGSPAKRIGARAKNLLELEQRFLGTQRGSNVPG